MYKVTTLTAAAFLVISSSAAFAENTTQPATSAQHHTTYIPHHDAKGQQKYNMFSDLHLSNVQRQKMHDIVQQAKAASPTTRLQSMQATHQLITASNFDAASAKNLVEQKVPQQVASLKAQNQMYNLLTAEQKAKFNQRYAARLQKIKQKTENKK